MPPKDKLPMGEMLFVINTAEKMRAVMERKKLRRAKAPCPKWRGMHAALFSGRGPKGTALHMQCDGTCKMVYME